VTALPPNQRTVCPEGKNILGGIYIIIDIFDIDFVGIHVVHPP
jgi:hypothetical protein